MSPPTPVVDSGKKAKTEKTKLIAASALLVAALALFGWQWREVIANYFLAVPDTVEPRIVAALREKGPGSIPVDISSPREQQERDLFTKLLSTQRANVVVVAPSAAVADSLDQTSRALMAFRLAQAIGARTSLTVADPTAVMRALGQRRRIYDAGEIDRLAASMGARLVITGEIANKRPTEGPNYAFDLVLTIAEATGKKTLRIDGIAFSDRLPPEEAFRNSLADVLASLPLGTLNDAPPKDERPFDDALPTHPKAFFSTQDTPAVARALALQMYALFQQPRSPLAASLWQRSILALDNVSDTTPHVRLLRSRAYFHLGRRPFAVTLLGDALTKPEAALRQIMDGNEPEAQAATEGIREPVLRLAAQIELSQLQANYDKPGESAAYRKKLEELPAYTAFLKLRYSQKEWFSDDVPGWLANTMFEEGIDAYPWQYRVLRWATTVHGALSFLALFLDHDYLQEGAIERVHQKLWAERGTQWLTAGRPTSLNQGDFFDAIAELNREAVIKRLTSVALRQALTERAAKATDKASRHFPMDADLAYVRAAALYDIASKAGRTDSESSTQRESRRLARDAYLWEGGETAHTPNLEWYLQGKSYVKYLDDPPGPDRFRPLPHLNRFAATREIPRAEIDRRINYNWRRLYYVQSNFQVIEDLRADLTATGQNDEQETLIRESAQRFHGNDRRANFIAALARENGDIELERQVYREAIVSNPLAWSNYYELGGNYLRHRQPKEAHDVMREFPLFAEPKGNLVAIGNHAFDAAWLLLKTGHPEFAKTFYEISARIDTGSGAQMMSQTSLSLMSGDSAGAAEHLSRQLERYRQSHVAGYYIEQLFLMGETESAWKAFDRWSRTMRDSGEPYWAAIVGHRILGHSDSRALESIEKWDRSPPGNGGLLRDSMVFMLLYIDRAPKPDSLSTMKRISALHNDDSLVHTAAGYEAFLKRDYPGVLREWARLHASIMNLSFRNKVSYTYTLPYYALAHAAGGSLESFRPTIDQYGARLPNTFDYLLAKAVAEASEKRFDKARDLLWQAFVQRPETGPRPIPTGLQLLETIEALYELTRDERYRPLLADFAKRLSTVWPTAYAYAFDAKYTGDANQRTRALALALHLDRGSAHVSHFDAAERQRAQHWLEQNRPKGMKSSARAP